MTDKSTTKALLHVGCGDDDLSKTPKPFQGGDWHEVRLDIDPDRKPDIIGTMTDMSAVADESVDAIYSSHNIEHLYAHEVPTALGEFLRVLKPDGFVVMACPDLALIAQIVAENRLGDTIYQSEAGPVTAHDVIFGYRPLLAQGQIYMAHKCGFTLKVLAESLSTAGFKTIHGRRDKINFALEIIATKSQIADEAIVDLADDYLRPRMVRQNKPS